MSRDSCSCGQPRSRIGNCPALQEDGLPLQCVGEWASDKHDYLSRYIEASSGPRGRFLKPSPKVPVPGGAAFIDLFAGPGRARARSGRVIDGSPLIALNHVKAKFSKVILCELADENLDALRSRTAPFAERVEIVPGDSNVNIEDVLRHIPRRGLNLAFYDPFAPKAFKWETLKRLGERDRMDLLIHFPTMGVKRNFDSVDIDGMVGCSDWRDTVKGAEDTVNLFKYLRRSLSALGYLDETDVRSLAVKDQGRVLYHLIYATKDKLGIKIWKSITKTEAGGQRNLFE